MYFEMIVLLVFSNLCSDFTINIERIFTWPKQVTNIN